MKTEDKKRISAEAHRKTRHKSSEDIATTDLLGATASPRRKNKKQGSFSQNTHWERAPPGAARVGRPSRDGGGGPVAQAGGAGAGRVATAGVGSWFRKADT